jgi:hypothetical protein
MKNYLIDIDGTITDDVPNEQPERMMTCEPKHGAVEKVNALYDAGHTITFFTSRTTEMADLTMRWLYLWEFKYHKLLTEKPRGGNYVWIDNLDVEYIRATEELWNGDLEVAQTYRRGQMVSLNGDLGTVIGLPGDDLGEDEKVPDGHLELWYGHTSNDVPVTWTVPAEYCLPFKGVRCVKH